HRALIEAGERPAGGALPRRPWSGKLGLAIVRRGETHIYRAESGNRRHDGSDEIDGRRRSAVAFFAFAHVFPLNSSLVNASLAQAKTVMTNTMWGGRFAASPAQIMEEINASIDFDKRLWRHDILASQAHVAMLGATGIVTAKEAQEITRGLDQIMAEIEAGTFKFSRALEDIHLNVESRLTELIGP